VISKYRKTGTRRTMVSTIGNGITTTVRESGVIEVTTFKVVDNVNRMTPELTFREAAGEMNL
jgi:hypothetical protein